MKKKRNDVESQSNGLQLAKKNVWVLIWPQICRMFCLFVIAIILIYCTKYVKKYNV